MEGCTVRVAAIDCGTNSIRLLVADIDGNNFREVHRDMEIVRLGAGVDQNKAFDPAAIERTLTATQKYAGVIAAKALKRFAFAQPVPHVMQAIVHYLSTVCARFWE